MKRLTVTASVEVKQHAASGSVRKCLRELRKSRACSCASLEHALGQVSMSLTALGRTSLRCQERSSGLE